MNYKYLRLVISSIQLRKPNSTDGYSVHQLIAACTPLDTNSLYCNLLQCSHFADTCVVAEQNGEVLGFASAYFPPLQPNHLFVWQIAVSSAARGQGLAMKMLQHLLGRPECQGISHVDCTITPDNVASRALFKSLAEQLQAEVNEEVMFDQQADFQGQHDSEMLVSIGPIKGQ